MPMIRISSALSPNAFFVRQLCLVIVLVLAGNSPSDGQGQDARLKAAVNDLTVNMKALDLAIQKRESANLPEGELQKANAQKLSALKQLRQHAQQFKDFADNDLVGNDIELFENEVRAIKAQMEKLGVKTVELLSNQQATSNPESTSTVNTSVEKKTEAATQGAPALPAAESTPTGSVAAPTTAAGTAAAPTTASGFATPVTGVNGLTFTYQLGVSPLVKKGAGKFQGGCTFGSGGITSDAAVWDVVVTLLAKEFQGFKRAGGFALTNGKGVIIMPLITMDPAAHLLVNGRKAYIGEAEQNIIASKFHFSNLSLNEVTDLLQALGKNDTTIKSAFATATPTITVYQILLSTDNKRPELAVAGALEEKLFGSDVKNVTHDFLASKLMENAGKELDLGDDTKVRIESPVPVPFSVPELTGDSAAAVEEFAKRIANNGFAGSLDLTSNTIQATTPTDQQGKEQPNQLPPLIIENECFQLSFVPGVQSVSSSGSGLATNGIGGSVNPAANFRGRISYLPDNIPLGLHLRAEGETSSDNRHDRRLAAGGDFTFRSHPFPRGWYFTFGATGNYSYSNRLTMGLNEWRTGGKLELQTPVQTFFPARGGNDQKPTFTVEGLATGGNAATARSTAFLARSTFTYTLQPTSRLFLDFNANAGWSDQARFARRKQFTFGSFTGRYAIYKDWDFIAKYECGRKDPDYLKSCGWQTGFGLKTK